MTKNDFLNASNSENSRRRFLEKLGFGSLVLSSGTHAVCSDNMSRLQRVSKNKAWDPYEYGATGDAKTLDTLAIQKTIDLCHAAGAELSCYMAEPLFQVQLS